MHFQHKVVQLSSIDIPRFYSMILNIKKDVNIEPCKKRKVFTSVPLQKPFIGKYSIPLWHMYRKIVMGVAWNKRTAHI